MVLSKDQIVQATDLSLQLVEVSEWGGSVYMKGLNALERDTFEASFMNEKGERRKPEEIIKGHFRSRLVSLSLCDEKGDRLFNDSEIELLGKKNGKVIDRLFLIAQSLSGIGEGEVEKQAKNSGGGRSEDSPSI